MHGKGIDELIGGPKNSFYEAWLDKEIEQVSIVVGEIDKLRGMVTQDPSARTAALIARSAARGGGTGGGKRVRVGGWGVGGTRKSRARGLGEEPE